MFIGYNLQDHGCLFLLPCHTSITVSSACMQTAVVIITFINAGLTVLMMDCGALSFCFCLLIYLFTHCVDLSKKLLHCCVL